MEEITYCQSCGMPLSDESVIGTNAGGDKNNHYCVYCFKDGKFTLDCTMEEMIAISAHHMKELGILEKENKTEQEAKEFRKGFFPSLKRWCPTSGEDNK